jgi:hypothetical protein
VFLAGVRCINAFQENLINQDSSLLFWRFGFDSPGSIVRSQVSSFDNAGIVYAAVARRTSQRDALCDMSRVRIPARAPPYLF